MRARLRRKFGRADLLDCWHRGGGDRAIDVPKSLTLYFIQYGEKIVRLYEAP